MIRDKLNPILQQKYSDKEVQLCSGSLSDPIAVFAAKHPSVGELTIWDDGNEARIEIGDITHSHLSIYTPNLTQDQLEEEVASQVLDFLEDIFADKYLLWKSQVDGSGGWQHRDYMNKPLDRRKGAEYFVWSGPF